MNRLKNETSPYLLQYAVVIVAAVFFAGCSYVQKKIDVLHMESLAGEIAEHFDPGSPEELERFLQRADLDELTNPRFHGSVTVSLLDQRTIGNPDGLPLIMEKLTFPSLLGGGKGNEKAVFYIYRRGDLAGRDVILWVPGMGVSDLAFLFIEKFFNQELSRGYDIMFYVPPYHLDRTEEGKGNGDGFFTSNTVRNIRLLLECAREIRTAGMFLREKGVRSIGGWGGSIGATALIIASGMMSLDHLCLMIPVLDLKTVALNREYMGGVVSMLGERGFTEGLIRKGYDMISPVNLKFTVNPGRVQILYADHDQLTPAGVIRDFAERQGIKNVRGYDRGHATILLTGGMYDDYGRFLDSLK